MLDSFLPLDALHGFNHQLLQEGVDLMGVLCQGSVERRCDLLVSASVQEFPQRSLDQRAARDLELPGDGIGLLDQAIQQGDGYFYTTSITNSITKFNRHMLYSRRRVTSL